MPKIHTGQWTPIDLAACATFFKKKRGSQVLLPDSVMSLTKQNKKELGTTSLDSSKNRARRIGEKSNRHRPQQKKNTTYPAPLQKMFFPWASNWATPKRAKSFFQQQTNSSSRLPISIRTQTGFQPFAVSKISLATSSTSLVPPRKQVSISLHCLRYWVAKGEHWGVFNKGCRFKKQSNGGSLPKATRKRFRSIIVYLPPLSMFQSTARNRSKQINQIFHLPILSTPLQLVKETNNFCQFWGGRKS